MRFVTQTEQEGSELGRDEEDMGKVPSLPFGIVLVAGPQGPEELGSTPNSAVSLLCTLGQDFNTLSLSFPIFKWTKS